MGSGQGDAVPEQVAVKPVQVNPEPEQVAAKPVQAHAEPEQLAVKPVQAHPKPEQMAVKPEQVDEAQTGEALSNSATTGAECCALPHVHVDAIRPTYPHRHP